MALLSSDDSQSGSIFGAAGRLHRRTDRRRLQLHDLHGTSQNCVDSLEKDCTHHRIGVVRNSFSEDDDLRRQTATVLAILRENIADDFAEHVDGLKMTT